MFLTAAILQSKRACDEQLALFKKTFPAGVEVTPEVCVAVADKFDWDWAARNLLPRPLHAEYMAKCALLRDDYEAEVVPWADFYVAKRALLWADYEAEVVPWADYEAKHVRLRAEYDAKVAPLWADYEAKCARLFGELGMQLDPDWELINEIGLLFVDAMAVRIDLASYAKAVIAAVRRVDGAKAAGPSAPGCSGNLAVCKQDH